MPSNFPAYLGLALLVVIAPGPDFAVVMKNCLMYGRRPGTLTSFGVVASLLVQGAAAALGVAALVVRSAVAFNVLKIVGALYLGYLGVLALRAAFARRGAAGDGPDGAGAPAAGTPDGRGASGDGSDPAVTRRLRVRAFRQGFLSNITNPKVLAFYFSMLPQFVNGRAAVLPQVALMAAVHAFFALVWLLILVAVLGRLRDVLRRPRIRRALEGLTGVALIGLGVRLITTPQ
ncbi:lysine transporter LysE [Sphaerisporangium rufum]|uniref:Lysine transporter LysE n=1 Tax=Sphaerisporangium rufum TaxID=1381558 RepID=A0A919R5P2_9ACTN|nr:LysE family translocator [Sphaerisporangium rufum]GII79743.1 lysine transporter LysE [Sphaerisporangium rufum]